MRAERENKVVEFFKSNNPGFLRACEEANTKATKRQASKWLKGKGIAWGRKIGRI